MSPSKPVLVGYDVDWDPGRRQWRASKSGVVLYGKNQRELELRRNQRAMLIADDLAEICRYAMANGYTPPRRQ
ncbi:hypothetical protein [Actinomadura sp. DC4]|uniref:hypothetical protein n=1 Tax=Actinomadura sp. DC4 TaxID=3055069 RepID=UPI0025B18B17|nr:hypothetical protein [Actinomadura sp. DC4]MDN3357794.1 hypothetical protein [Actinomadura sp. DC4]